MIKKLKKVIIVFFVFTLLFGINLYTIKAASIARPVLKQSKAVTYNSIQIQWKNVKGASGYAIYRKNSGTNYKKIATIYSARKCSYIDNNVNTGTVYTYTVRAFSKGKGKTTWSTYDKKGVQSKAILSKPVIKSVIGGTARNLTVTWGKVSGASGYMVYRATEKSTNYQLGRIISKGTTLSYKDSNLKNGSTYSYKIKAYRVVGNKKAYSSYSKSKAGKVSTTVQETTTFDEFSKAASELVKNNKTTLGNSAAADNPFFARRLIVKSNGAELDFTKNKPKAVVKGIDNIYLVQFTTSSNAQKAMGEIANWPNVVYAEPDSYNEVTMEEENITAAKSWGVSEIGADKYAKYVSMETNSEIKVAVVDSGVSSHSFLGNRITSDGYDFVDNDARPTDLKGHGTHVAGTIVDCTPNLNVKIIPVRVLDENGEGSTSTVGIGIRFAADHGAKVINLSLGGDHSNFIEDNIKYAINRGITVVVSAGNNHGNIESLNYCPAHIKNAICVGAIDSNRKRASFSNVGNSLDVVAPGVGIVSCVPGGGFRSMQGTSMAAPHISALAAMLKLMNPSYTPLQIEQTIKSGSKDLGTPGWDKNYGYGVPDFSSLAVVAPTGISLSRNSISLETGKVFELMATVSPNNATDKKVTWSSSNTNVAAVSNGTVVGKTTGTAIITARTSNGKTATCSVTVKNPVIAVTGISLNRNSIALTVGETYTLQADIYPENATDKSILWSSNNNVATVKNGTVEGKSAGTAIITAETGNGKKASCEVIVRDSESILVTCDKQSYECTLGDDLIVNASVTLDKNILLNSNKYVLYYAYTKGFSWIEIGAYNIDGSTFFEKRWNCDAELLSYKVRGKEAQIVLKFNTAKMPTGSRWFTVSVFPSNNFATGGSLYDCMFRVNIK